MRRAWIRRGDVVEQVAAAADGSVRLADGTRLEESRIDWQPPPFGTLLALGLNYLDHIRELGREPPAAPLVFVKGPASAAGHLSRCYRPDGVETLNFEGELVAVIGRTARRVRREAAMDYVGGYTICNDYAIQEYLENYYRPNLRVKSREGLTVLGPWLIDAGDLPNPHEVSIRTFVNGELKQDGNTRDMVFDIPTLIEHISEFMTLREGDMIATGTPHGTCYVAPGDEVSVEIAGVGRLTNYIVSEQEYFTWPT